MTCSRVFLVAEDVLIGGSLGLVKVEIQELVDAVAEERVSEHVGDLLDVLRLDGRHVASLV